MTIRTFALALTAATTLTSVASAQSPLPIPRVEYSADRVVESSAGTFTGKVYGTPDKERADNQMNGVGMVQITRRDKDLSWNLMPDQKLYIESDFKTARAQTTGIPADVTFAQVGPDTVEGHATTKYKLLTKDGKAGGFLWFTADGVMVKMDAVQKEGKDSSRITMTLKNLQVGPQDPQLFEVPSGFTKMPGVGMAIGGMSKDGGATGGITGAVTGAATRTVTGEVTGAVTGAIKGGFRGVFRR